MAQSEINNNPTNFSFEVWQRSSVNPIILVDTKDSIVFTKNLEWSAEKNDSLELYTVLNEIKTENEPIVIQQKDSLGQLLVNQKVYYGDSLMLKKLKYYPLALSLIVFLFGAVLYFVFKTAKVSEQNRLWVAMAKETAHQIGTPLSSMMGWTTLLREKSKKDNTPLREIEKDIKRLNVIAERFSKIGSIPVLREENIIFSIGDTVSYLKQRSSDQIVFDLQLPQDEVKIPLNTQLFNWTLENLVKNGIDAMKGSGRLLIALEEFSKYVIITVSDTGSGIKKEDLSKLFAPGFTTKKRGWGLGLSLAKRIVEDYHHGKISVQRTARGKGTTFLILLKKKSHP